jgi:tetratricopeptide (TPR) repeat protein
LKSTDQSRWKWIAVSCAAFAGSILSKSLGMTLPLVLLLLDLWPLRRFGREKTSAILIEKIPYFLLSAAAVAITSWAVNATDARYSSADYPLTQSLAQPGYRVSFYLIKTLLPFGLSPLYFYRPELGAPHVMGWLAMVGVSILVFLRHKQAPAVAVAWFSFGALAAPFAGLAQVGPHFASDRNSYLLALPLAALFAAGLALPQDPRIRRGAGIAAVAVLAALAALSVRQCSVWRDSLALWDRAIEIEPDVYYTWQKRGTAKSDLGRWGDAKSDFDRALSLNPRFPDSWSGRGLARMKTGDLAGAIGDFGHFLELRPDSAAMHFNRGMALLRLGRPAAALADFNRAGELRPDDPDPLAQRGVARALLGDPDGGLADLNEAVRRKNDAGTLLLRATVRGIKGDFKGAVDDCTQAIQQNPDAPEAYVRRGAALLELGDKAGAARDFEKALQLAPPGWPQRRQTEMLLQRAQAP